MRLAPALCLPLRLACAFWLLNSQLKIATGLLSLGEGLQTTAVVLLLLRKLAPHPRLARALLEEGAERRLRELLAACPPELHHSADGLLQLLLSGGVGGGGGQLAPALPAAEGRGPGARRSLFEGPGGGGVAPPPRGGAVYESAASLGASPAHGGPLPLHHLPPVADPAASPHPGYGGRGLGHEAYGGPAAAAGGYAPQGGGSGGGYSQYAAAGGYEQHGGGSYEQHGGGGSYGQHEGGGGGGFDELDARAMRAKARADWRSEEAVAGELAALIRCVWSCSFALFQG